MTRYAHFVILLTLAVEARTSSACEHCARQSGAFCCEVCRCECCPCQLQERTVMVPMCVTETHMVVKIIKTTKEREETYTVFERVPKKRKFTKECCYLETEVKSKEITCTACRRVQYPMTLVDTVKVPVTELHEGVRRREVCGKCGVVCVEEPCTCTVTRTMDVPRVQNCMREDVVFEDTKKTIDYCVTSPKFHTIDCGEETVCELVPVEKTRKVQVCVPEAIKVPVDVQVTRTVAKKIICCEECWCEIQRQANRKHHKDGKECKDCK